MKEIKIGLVVMASGLGKRFGSNKLMALLDGKPLVRWIIDNTDGLFDRRVVVTRSQEVEELCQSAGIDCIYHTCPNRNDTIRIGLNALKDDVDYCFFVPGDQPLIGRDTIIRLIDEAKNCEGLIVRPGYGDTAGAPVGFHSAFYDELLTLPEGARGSLVVRNNESRLRIVSIGRECELWDVDTIEDFNRVREVLGQR